MIVAFSQGKILTKKQLTEIVSNLKRLHRIAPGACRRQARSISEKTALDIAQWLARVLGGRAEWERKAGALAEARQESKELDPCNIVHGGRTRTQVRRATTKTQMLDCSEGMGQGGSSDNISEASATEEREKMDVDECPATSGRLTVAAASPSLPDLADAELAAYSIRSPLRRGTKRRIRALSDSDDDEQAVAD